jgi:DNA-binding XRE family transcriptional regulator
MDEQMAIDSTVVKKLRDERSWSQEHLAAVADLSLRTIQRVESEGSGSLETRMALASAFNVTPGSLLPRTAQNPAGSDGRTLPFPGKRLGIVFGLSGALLGGICALVGAMGMEVPHGIFDGIFGTWLGLTCGVAGVVVNAYYRRSMQQKRV